MRIVQESSVKFVMSAREEEQVEKGIGEVIALDLSSQMFPMLKKIRHILMTYVNPNKRTIGNSIHFSTGKRGQKEVRHTP